MLSRELQSASVATAKCGVRDVQKRVDGFVVACGDLSGEVTQKHGVSKGSVICRLRSPSQRDPLLEQPSLVAVDAGLEGVRRVT